MVYADSDFFLALIKSSDWLKTNAEGLLSKYNGNIQTSIITFIEMMLIARKFKLPPIRTTISMLKLTNFPDTIPLKAAKYIEDGIGVFDAFHAAYCDSEIISSDEIYDKIGLIRIKLEAQ